MALLGAALAACSGSIESSDLPTDPIAYVRQGASEGILSLDKFREAARIENPDDPSSKKGKLTTTLSLLSPASGESTTVPDSGLGSVPCDWSADGSHLLVARAEASSSNLQLYSWNRLNGAWTRVERGPVGSGAGIADGPILLVWHGPVRTGRSYTGAIYVSTTEKARAVMPGTTGGSGPDVSPDGRTVVFAREEAGSARGSSIYLETLGESEPRLITAGSNPRFSRDGKWIAFARKAAGNSDIWIMRADGSAKRHITRTGYDEEFPALSRDGRFVAYASSRANKEESLLYITRIADGVEREIVHNGLNSRPVW